MKLRSSETELVGAWVVEKGHVRGDETNERIGHLVKNELQQIATSPEFGAWEILYRDPVDGRLWEHTYPQSELHGGGPRKLSVISPSAAEEKYGVTSATADRTEDARDRVERSPEKHGEGAGEGTLEIVNGTVMYRPENLTFAVDEVRVLGELTTPASLDRHDYFLVFVLDPDRWIEVPIYEFDLPTVLDQLSAELGAELELRLAAETKLHSRVAWPASLVGKRIFDHHPLPRRGFRGLVQRLFGDVPVDLRLTPEIQDEARGVTPKDTEDSSTKLQPHETELVGAWISYGNRVRGDETERRIGYLRKRVLTQIATASGGWDVLYRDPEDGRLWELTRPDTGYHGGGPCRLHVLSTEAASGKYGLNAPLEGPEDPSSGEGS